MDVLTGGRLSDGDHVVSFYDDDDRLCEIVTSYLVASARDGDAMIVIATREHLALFALAWAAANLSIDEDRIQLLDADATLGEIMRDGSVDRDAFEASVGRLVRDTAARGHHLRAYGEMVGLLSQRGNRAAAVALEELWNDLGTTIPFALLCGYPCSVSSDAAAADDVASACQLHTHVDTEATQAFDPMSADVRAARRFVANTLADWRLGQLSDDCTLLVSELASNAVRHASSPFSVTLARIGDAVLVSVADESPIGATLTFPDPSEPTGRGLRVVDTLASRWGQTPIPGGKRVWALLR